MDVANQAPALPGAGYRSLGELLSRQAEQLPASVAFSCGGQELSYARLDALSSAVAHWLIHELDLPPGSRVALQLSNRLDWPVLAFAVFKAALVLVNISDRASARERDAMLQDSGACLLLCTAQGVPPLGVSGVALHDAAQVVDEAGIRFPRAGLPARHCNRESLALLQYTGGSSGRLRAAMLSHDNLLANLAQLQERLQSVYPPAGACMLLPLPLSHIYGFTLGLLGGIWHGHHTVLVAALGDEAALLSTLQARRCQGIFGLDTLYRRLCNHPGMLRVDFSELRICSAGGMPLSQEVVQDWLALTACPLTEGYGLSECSPLVACSPAGQAPPGSQGRPLAGTALRICDAQGRELPPGVEGELRVSGPQVMRGYWQDPADTACSFDAEGWLRTGDIARVDAEGYLYLCGRADEVAIIAGYKVWPREVEDCLLAHPAVLEACVLAFGPLTRQALAAFVVTGSETDATILQTHCAERLAAYKVPRRIEFLSHLPRSHSGKLQRQRLAALLAS